MDHSLHLEMCFISDNNDLLYEQVESELIAWFDLPSQWFLHSKQEQNLHIVTAEVHSKVWESEETMLDYVEAQFNSKIGRAHV